MGVRASREPLQRSALTGIRFQPRPEHPLARPEDRHWAQVGQLEWQVRSLCRCTGLSVGQCCIKQCVDSACHRVHACLGVMAPCAVPCRRLCTCTGLSVGQCVLNSVLDSALLNVLNSAVSNACVPESYGPVCCAMQEVVSSQPSQKGHTEAQVRNNAESHTRNNAAAARFFNSRGY